MPPRSANILTSPRAKRAEESPLSVAMARLLAVALAVCLTFTGTLDVFAQTTKHKKKKSTKPKSPVCQTGCKPNTTSPALNSATPEDPAAQKEVGELARDLHQGVPGAYEKL